MDFNFLTNFSKEDILKISSLNPEKIFLKVENEEDLKKGYRKLSSVWHPDKHMTEKTDVVFAHIQNLYEAAREKFKDNIWNKGLVISFLSIDGKKYQLKYLKKNEFDLGACFIAEKFVAWVFDIEYEDLAHRALNMLKSLKYANSNMREEMSKFIPVVKSSFKTKDSFVIVMEKDPDLLCLEDVLSHYKNKIPPKHVAWILSNCYNLACFFEYNKIMQGGISLANLFINPQTHAACLMGGWWFSHLNHEKLKALNSEAVSIAPLQIVNEKKATTSLDLEMIRLVGRKILGDKSGIYLLKNKEIPSPLIQWLRNTANSNAFKEYEIWHSKVLKDSFGVRRFIKMELTTNDIYN